VLNVVKLWQVSDEQLRAMRFGKCRELCNVRLRIEPSFSLSVVAIQTEIVIGPVFLGEDLPK
jgi:hypothetical protein